MTAKKFTFFCLFPLILAASLALFTGCGGKGPTDPPPVLLPDILIFSASPSDIVPPDSALVTWKTIRTDSIKIFPSGQKLTPVDSGQIYLKPTVPTQYSLVAYGGGKKDSVAINVTMSALAASIGIFSFEPDTLVNGDSSVITWKTNQADSIVINQGVGKVTPVDSGQVTVYASNSVPYRAIAYSIYGNDTVTINVLVQNPVLIRTLTGNYYKGLMGQSNLTPALNFAVADGMGTFLKNLWVDLRIIDGDGTLIPADSVQTNSSGLANVMYNFSGQLGHAVVAANFRDVDTVEVEIRANTIIPGNGGQGRYVLFSDIYSDVINWNGNPEREDEDPANWWNYAVYEATQDFVAVIEDANTNHFADPGENVIGVILTIGYEGKTKDSIGIGSTYNQIESVYGDADSIFFSPSDGVNPPAIGVIYDSISTTFYIDTVIGSPPDTNKPVLEIHINDPSFFRSPRFNDDKVALGANSEIINFRRFRK